MTFRRGLIAFLLIASGCTLAVLPVFAISWGKLPQPSGGVSDMNAEDFGRALSWAFPDQTSGLVAVWFGSDTFRAVAGLAPFYTLLLPLQGRWTRWVAAGIDILLVGLGVYFTFDALNSEFSTTRDLWLGLGVCTALLALAVLHAVGRIRWAATALAVVMGLAALVHAAALLDFQAAVMRSPGDGTASTSTDVAELTMSPAWLMFVGFTLTAIGCAVAGQRRHRATPHT